MSFNTYGIALPWSDPRGGGAQQYPIAEGVFQARLFAWSINELRMVRASGRAMEVYGEILVIGDTNFSFFANATTRISNQGLDTGQLVSADTVYHAYVSNGRAEFTPYELRLSTASPQVAADGVLYLRSQDNGRNWRYVGTVKTNATAEFVDNFFARNVASYYNRRPQSLFICPNYSDDGNDSTYSFAPTATWAEIDSAGGGVASWVSLGEDATIFQVQLCGEANGALVGVGILRENGSVTAGVVRPGGVADGEAIVVQRAQIEARGGYTATLVGLNGDAGNWPIYSDFAAAGSVEDVPATFVQGIVWG